ncbi:hypothetical protein HDV00_008645 [Rhizophlyctis rosea]|nr:hypothetical protein HDV00_008645 [Rhizophlyctis rosea]
MSSSSASHVLSLPDFLIILFAHPAMALPDLLKCEQICKQWWTIIQSNQPLFRQKLVDNFPAGCLPVPYGNECWHDVACLWWAWKRPWAPPPISDGIVEACHHGETKSRASDGVVRDVTGHLHTFEDAITVQAVRADGQVLLRGSSPFLQESQSWIDVIFEETQQNARPITDLLISPSESIRPTAIARQPPDSTTVIYENWDTGEIIAELPNGMGGVYGSHTVEYPPFSDSMGGFESDNVNIIPLNNPTNPLTITLADIHWYNITINETLVAYIGDINPGDPSKSIQITLTNLATKRTVATFPLDRNTMAQAHLHLTRFNFFLIHYAGDCMVFDLNLTLLYTIPISYEVRGFQYCLEKVTDWGVFFYPEDYDLRDDNTQFFEVLVWDPRRRTLQRLGLYELEASPAGYLFSTVEYPVDSEGKRTGAGGTTKMYWRKGNSM